MKKTLSLLLSIVVLANIFVGSSISAFARDLTSNATKIDFGTTYTDYVDKEQSYSGNSNWYYKSYILNVPASGEINICLKSANSAYVDRYITEFEIYDTSNLNYSIWDATIKNYGYNVNDNEYYANLYLSLSKGSYILVFKYCYYDNNLWGPYSLCVNYKVNISKPSNLKVSSRGTTSLKITWNKIASVSGYQVQRKVNGTYKTLKNTSNNYYTISDLKSAASYSIRVRAYKDISGKRYYSGWTAITTCTKPSKPTILTPSTNSKHQITVKWKKLSRGSGYQVQFCKNKSCSNVIATKTVSGISKTSYTGKNFTKGRKYYVRVRAYKIVNNTKYYGSWSNVKSIKCK